MKCKICGSKLHVVLRADEYHYMCRDAGVPWERRPCIMSGYHVNSAGKVLEWLAGDTVTPPYGHPSGWFQANDVFCYHCRYVDKRCLFCKSGIYNLHDFDWKKPKPLGT